MIRTKIPIKGMHCHSCELLVEEALKDVRGVTKVKVNYRRRSAFVESKKPLGLNKIRHAVREAGYDVGYDESAAWLSRDPKDYRDLALCLIALAAVYFVGRTLGLFRLGISTNDPSSLLVVLAIGLTAGVSTCMALVGGLILGISARHAENHPDATPMQRFRPHLFFNLGRIASYTVAGGLIGLFGKAFQLSGTTLGVLTIAVGLFMLMLGLKLTEVSPRISGSSLALPSFLSRRLNVTGRNGREYSHANSAVVGALTIFLPCGFTQAMQLYALSTGRFWSGALIMGIFAMGTAPGLLGVGGLTSLIRGPAARKFFKFAGVVVIALAIVNISNGLNLTGWKSVFASSGTAAGGTSADVQDGAQVVRMTQNSNGYSPKNFTVVKGIPVRWLIDSKSSGSCATSIMASKIGVRQNLKPGENEIDFTPKETGQIRFSCAMGMYGGSFNVVESLDGSQNSTSNGGGTGQAAPLPEVPPDAQVLKTTYRGPQADILPREFTVKAGIPVDLEVFAEQDGQGCMGSVMVQGLDEEPQFLVKGQTLRFIFTPQKSGSFYITCAMGTPRGRITVTA